jgi:acetylornithine deacetylase
MQPIIAHKGTHRFPLRVHGREAHSSYVTHGVNAIEYAARLVVYIRQIADRLAQIETRDYGFTVPYSTLSTGLIQGGIAANVVPKDCVFQFDMRTLPHASPGCLYQEIRAYAEALAREMQAVDAQVRHRPGMGESDRRGSPRPRPTPSCNGPCSCREPTVGKVSYGTEAGLFQKMGVPTVICGPGDIAEAHRPNEFVALEQLAQCEAFMDRILETGYAP